MNRHQILSGACNAGDRCYAVGSVEGVPFTAYAAGCNIVILASTFERVQIIPGATHGYIKISAIDCSTDTGKIAAAYEDKIYIFEPTPLIQSNQSSSHSLDYRWVQTGSFAANSNIAVLSWNLEGTRLLTGGSLLQMWKEKCMDAKSDEPSVKFEIGDEKETKPVSTNTEDDTTWECIWDCQTSGSILHMSFSPDGTLFATCGKNDRLVKVWYENKNVIFPAKSMDLFDCASIENSSFYYSYVYVAHPRAVTHISWRRTSKYMPKTSVSNMLVTSCLDNICRIWVETVLPDDGLINMTQFDPQAAQNPKFRTHRHKHRFIQRLKHMKTCFHIRRNAKNGNALGTFITTSDGHVRNSPIPSLPSSYSVHDFHSYGYHGTGVAPAMHFHLSASINAETDIPLVPSMQTTDPANQNNFILHWLNNKEMYFSAQAESILHDITQKVIEKEDCHDVSGVTNGSINPDEKQPTEDNTQRKVLTNTYSCDDNNSDEQSSVKNASGHGHQGHYNMNCISNTTSINSLAQNNMGINTADSLDMKIECLLRDWHHNPDLLFSIHPIDGSFLIWVIEWLDDYYPGSFRQAQISFSTRIPSAFPLGDAMSMSTIVNLYNLGVNSTYFKDIWKIEHKRKPTTLSSVFEEQENVDPNEPSVSDMNSTSNQRNQNINNIHHSERYSTNSGSYISMVTKHSNGTLNLWQLNFADKTKFTQLLSVGHYSRASGHRFRVNDITCHPVLPLLLTTSHHNLPDSKNLSNSCQAIPGTKDACSTSGFCSELILWRVDSVGPLSHSGGVSELARISSPKISAFSNVAWIPTLLPSTTLGSYSNSPSACFVASDGENLRLYQAVIDARTLLAEISCSERLGKKSTSLTTLSSEGSSGNFDNQPSLNAKIKIVSQQSTARPGCVIQLDEIAEATHNWQNTQFLHVFQEQLITGATKERPSNIDNHEENQPSFMQSHLSAMVDLQKNAEFEEPFYIVILEKTIKGSTIHTWKITIASKTEPFGLPESAMYVPDSNLVQDLEDTEVTATRPSVSEPKLNDKMKEDQEGPHISIVTKKVSTQELPLPDGVDVIHAAPAAGHLSSSSIYPACFAPYLILTACSDSLIRFWKCNVTNIDNDIKYEWKEWSMLSKDCSSAIDISGQPLNISAAYSGRVACAFKYGKSFTRPKGDPDSRYINLCVAIYECESTGGSEWILEDTIHLRNIHLPTIQVDKNLDLSYLNDVKMIQKKQKLNQVLHTLSYEDSRSLRNGETTPDLQVKPIGILAVPSFSTLQSLKKSISENGNTCPLTQKHLVQLDWVSKEDGSHILTVAVGSKILLYTPVCSDLAQANMKAMKECRTASRPLLRKASSLAQPHFNDEIRWMKLRQIDLMTADGLPPLPMHMSWVRDGILVVGMDSEMHVYSQWKSRCESANYLEDPSDTRNLKDEALKLLAHESSQLRLPNIASMPYMSKISSSNLQLLSNDKKKKSSNQIAGQPTNSKSYEYDYMTDCGLFQASRIACPVLPQYHPKQLMELLNSGKVRWVKAILGHLVRCMNGSSYMQNTVMEGDNMIQNSWTKQRNYSMSYAASSPLEQRDSTTQIPEELMLDYAEINSIPPLPLWVLLTADKETSRKITKQNDSLKDYNDLFDLDTNTEDSLEELLANDSDIFNRVERRQSFPDKGDVSQFGPRQGQLLSSLLTHIHLPGLSSLDQMHLLALADTVSTCNTDFTERFAIDAARIAIAKENATPNDTENISIDSLDDCGLRFLLAMKHYSYLLRCLPITQRNNLQKQGVGTSNIVWAFHSESEEELLNLIPSYNKGQLKWATLKELGVGWWLRSITLLRQCIESLAKSAYQAKQDPLDAALYYLAMKKKSIVWGLFRSMRDEKMTAFFSNNFTEDRWRKAALKNAFVLLGKQRFTHAVAFFLLANSLNDAIEVCLNKLDDIQLALVICRLYEVDVDFDSSTYKKLLTQEVLGNNSDLNFEDKQNLSEINPDPFIRSMGFWIFKNYSESLNTLLLHNVGQNHHTYSEEDVMLRNDSTHAANPNVFNFYVYLRTHPLLIRQHIASTAQERNHAQVVISGFSFGDENSKVRSNDNQLRIEDAITPLERQLYFTTAHGHFKAGCPALALEVLNKLPTKISESNTNTNSEAATPKATEKESPISTGMMDWGPTKTVNFESDFDWGAPSAPKADDEFKIEWEDEGPSEDIDEVEDNKDLVEDKEKNKPAMIRPTNGNNFDIMAQQLKFVACLKILMEELSTLATGFEVDGGQLRFQLYIWLEREVDALKLLCNYSNSAQENPLDENNSTEINQSEKDAAQKFSDKPTLHEILVQEKQDFEAKVQRAARRKAWLKSNETLLRTLLSYCSLHGASGGGLASVRMELILLLQELQQEKTQQQLLSPLPFPTTLPLLSACVAGNKTVIADPIKYLQSHTHDMLQTVSSLSFPEAGYNENTEIFVLKDLAVALSSCIYQSLCDSESFVVNQTAISGGSQSPGIENIAKLNASCHCSHLMVNANIYKKKRKYSVDEPVMISTLPPKWPGVTNLRALLAREKDEDIPRLNVLLLEAFLATYTALLVYALSTCDCHILYRLATQDFSCATWAKLFGGGIKKLLRKATTENHLQQSVILENPATTDTNATDNSVWNTVTSLTKQRVKLNMKLLGQFTTAPGAGTMKEDKPTYREQFVPPEMSMVSFFLLKPIDNEPADEDDYDTDNSMTYVEDEETEEDVFGDKPVTNKNRDNVDHLNPQSHAWLIMRLAIIKLVETKLHEFINIAGIENQELPVASSLSHDMLRTFSRWQEVIKAELLSRGPTSQDFIPGCFIDSDAKGPAIHKYRNLLEKQNTPFNSTASSGPARRLWNYLVRQEPVQHIFIRSIFGKKRTKYPEVESQNNQSGSIENIDSKSDECTYQTEISEPIKIIHKDQEAISAFCINNVSSGLLSIATPREIQEMDISLLLNAPNWYEDECEYDLINLTKDVDTIPTTSFLVFQTNADKNILNQMSATQHPSSNISSQSGIGVQSGRGTNTVLRHKVDNVKRMSAHPLMPLYLTGGLDGSVQMWEWGHQQAVCTPRPPGTFAKVTRCRFSQHGNKFGITDGDGNLSLWQAGLASHTNRSFFNYQCHNKITSDFVFLGSCSLVATAGHSSENKNVSIWDTLLPHKSSLVHGFTCHDQGASSLAYAPQQQVLLSTGKKGDVCIFDVRQRILKNKFQAHESPIKCMAIDPHEEMFVTGSAEGDIKVWDLSHYNLLYSFPGEHAKGSFFKHIGQGVSQLHLDASGRLFSCGCDGSMKVRQIPTRDTNVSSMLY